MKGQNCDLSIILIISMIINQPTSLFLYDDDDDDDDTAMTMTIQSCTTYNGSPSKTTADSLLQSNLAIIVCVCLRDCRFHHLHCTHMTTILLEGRIIIASFFQSCDRLCTAASILPHLLSTTSLTGGLSWHYCLPHHG